MSESHPFALPTAARRIFCNRTLNLRSIKAIGYDMDYTLLHYRVDEWERCAYEHVKTLMAADGWPVEGLEFDPELVTRGLIVDSELGNLVKCNRFGYVKRAIHGTQFIDYETWRQVYVRTRITLSQDRFRFLNTLFSLSEGCLYLQLVDLMDQGLLEHKKGVGYAELWRKVRDATDQAHMQGYLKAEITANKDRFVDIDELVPLTLLDQRRAGKTLLLITNSDWDYTHKMMRYAMEPYIPGGGPWQQLFDVIITSARKPDFFSSRGPAFEMVSDEGLLKAAPHGFERGRTYAGGNASQVERMLGVSGDQILYVGDHMHADVVWSKRLSWRTALVLRELEPEVEAIEAFTSMRQTLNQFMDEKELVEFQISKLRLEQQRRRLGYGPTPSLSDAATQDRLSELRERLVKLDEEIRPLATAAGELNNRHWGLIMRAGNDKSHLARQIERHADVYTSRVSNFLEQTPFIYLRSPHGSLPHDLYSTSKG